MIRFCTKNLNSSYKCGVGWGQISCLSNGENEFKGCFDEPKEVNCKNLVDENPQVSYCHFCGTALGIEKDEPLFGVHIKELINVLKNK
jgi:hypothetical protein